MGWDDGGVMMFWLRGMFARWDQFRVCLVGWFTVRSLSQFLWEFTPPDLLICEVVKVRQICKVERKQPMLTLSRPFLFFTQ